MKIRELPTSTRTCTVFGYFPACSWSKPLSLGKHAKDPSTSIRRLRGDVRLPPLQLLRLIPSIGNLELSHFLVLTRIRFRRSSARIPPSARLVPYVPSHECPSRKKPDARCSQRSIALVSPTSGTLVRSSDKVLLCTWTAYPLTVVTHRSPRHFCLLSATHIQAVLVPELEHTTISIFSFSGLGFQSRWISVTVPSESIAPLANANWQWLYRDIWGKLESDYQPNATSRRSGSVPENQGNPVKEWKTKGARTRSYGQRLQGYNTYERESTAQ